MRNLILLFTLLVSGFVSAQEFDFSCINSFSIGDNEMTFIEERDTGVGYSFLYSTIDVNGDEQTFLVYSDVEEITSSSEVVDISLVIAGVDFGLASDQRRWESSGIVSLSEWMTSIMTAIGNN